MYGSKIFIGDKSDKYLNVTGAGIFGNILLNLDGIISVTQLPQNSKGSSDGIFSYPREQTVSEVTSAFL